MKPAIVVVGYNRPADLFRLLNNVNEAFFDTDDVPLIISLDKASNEQTVKKVADDFEWKHGEKIVRTFPERQGLRKHIIQCGDLSEQYGSVIILEDDLLVSPNFYRYVQQALDFYENEERVTGVALYSHEWNGYARRNFIPLADRFDVYMGQYSITWGQCWTKKWWNGFKAWYLAHEDKLEINTNIPMNINRWSDRSWGKYFVNYIVEKDLYYVIPRVSLSTNCCDLGDHVMYQDNAHQVRLQVSPDKDYLFPEFENACHYDIYFENMDICRFLPEWIPREDVCINLSGINREYKRRYVLSTKELPYKRVKTYGLQLRPYEMNIMWDFPGEEIFLYDTTEAAVPPRNNLKKVLKYELRGFNVRDVAVIFTELFRKSITTHMKSLFRKKK